jgi:hypothetical protein
MYILLTTLPNLNVGSGGFYCVVFFKVKALLLLPTNTWTGQALLLAFLYSLSQL